MFRFMAGMMGLWLGTINAANGAAYSYTPVATTGAQFTNVSGTILSMNNAGIVVFRASLASGDSAIYAGDGQTLTPIVTTPAGSSQSLEDFAINNDGDVAFSGNLSGGVGINAKTIYKYSNTSGTFGTVFTAPPRIYGNLGINDGGAITFLTDASSGSGREISAGTGNPRSLVADTHGPFLDLNLYTRPINNDGDVVFFASLDAGGSGIYKFSNGQLTTIAEGGGAVGGQFGGMGGGPAINDSGTVAFLASLSAGGYGIYTGNGGNLTTIADTVGPLANLDFPSINSAGDLMFLAQLDGSAAVCILNGPDPILNRVVCAGDTINGVTLSSVDYGLPGFNDSGEVAFIGRTGNTATIYRATPLVIVPPVITSSTPPGGTVGTLYTVTYAASGTTPITYGVTNGALPPGLTLSSSGLLSGTPTTAGTYNGTVTASNGSLPDATQNFSIVVAAPPTITSAAPLPGTVNMTYSFTYVATGTAPVSYSVTTGALPPGLTLSSGGMLSGTPTTAGTYTGTVTASNGALPNATQGFSITIAGGGGGGGGGGGALDGFSLLALGMLGMMRRKITR